MTTLRDRTWVDYAIWATAAAVVILLAYLGYAVWAQRTYNAQTSPAARAVANLEKIVSQRPQDPGARIRLAQAYTAAGRLDDAIKQYQDALKLDKNSAEAFSGLGLIAMSQQRWDIAQGYWRQIIDKLETGEYASKDSRLEAAYYYLGTSLMEQKKYEDAVGYLKEALRIRRDASDTHYALSIAYRQLDSTAKSLEELKAALLFDPTMPEANYDLGQILLKEGDVADAAERFRVAADKAAAAEKPLEALKAIGSATDYLKKAQALQASNLSSATAAARVAVALDPNDAAAVRLLAGLYERLGKKAEALAVYQKLLLLVPDDKAANKAVVRLGKNAK